MQQLSRTCMVAEHYSKAIEYVCTYPECKLSRFLCSKCILGSSHRHNQQGQYSHIVDNRDFYDLMKIKVEKAKGNYQDRRYDIEKSFVHLKLIISEIQNLLKNVENVIEEVVKGNLQIFNISDLEILENQLLNVQQHGFNQINDQSVNNLINLQDLLQNKHIYKQLEDQVPLIIKSAQQIKVWRLQEVGHNGMLLQKIKDAKYQIKQLDTAQRQICSATVSNDLKYIVDGHDDGVLKIWNQETNNIIKSMTLWGPVFSCRFTDDDTLLNVGSNFHFYQFDVKDQFKKLHELRMHDSFIMNIICISNTVVLTSSFDKTIIKTDIKRKKQLYQIFELDLIFGLDYNKINNVIASGSDDDSIKLWNGVDGSLILEKPNAHNNDKDIKQVLFLVNHNQLVSLDQESNFMIWNIHYDTKQLEQQQLIKDYGYNISLVQNQQYIIAIGQNFIKVHSIKGELVREIDHDVDDVRPFNAVQLDSMKVLLIQGYQKLLVCKLDVDVY